MKKESKFQSELIKELKQKFEGCIILKTNPNYIQGFPDLIILYKRNWACLECKQSARAKVRPNQRFYISLLNAMSYASFVYPENKEEVLHELEQTFKTSKRSRISIAKSKRVA